MNLSDIGSKLRSARYRAVPAESMARVAMCMRQSYGIPMSPQYLSEIERGKAPRVEFRTIEALLKYYGMKVTIEESNDS